MVALSRLVEAIELCQTVLNKDSLMGVDKTVTGVASLKHARADNVAFLSDIKYLNDFRDTGAGVVLVSHKFLGKIDTSSNAIIVLVKDAYLAHASISALFEHAPKNGIHPTAIIDKTALIGSNVSVGAYSVIGEGVVIGDDTVIGHHVTIEDCAKIGCHCHLHNHVNIAHHCVLGDDVRIHAFASIGSEGFGFAPKMGEQSMAWQRIAQLGRVVIGSRVRIGAGTCVDRGAVDDTVIGDDVIVDNLVQIAHNVQVGHGTAIAAKTGIAGSTVIGNNCIIGGGVGISGHLQIADNVTLTGRTFVAQSIEKSGSYSSGTVAMPTSDWRRAAIKFRQMGEKV